MEPIDLTQYQPREGVLSQDVNGETVLLDLDGQRYFGLNEVGSRVWEGVRRGEATREVVDQLLASYDVERVDLEKDVASLINDLVDKGLLEPSR